MFETEKSRREFIQALKMGKISPGILQKAMGNVSVFSDCTMAEISWMFTHNLPQIQQFGGALSEVIDDPAKIGMMLDQFTKERNPQRIEQLAQSLGQSSAADLLPHLSRMVNDKSQDVRQKAVALLVNMQDWPRHKNVVRVLLQDPKPAISEVMLKHVIRAAPRPYLRELRQATSHPNEELRTLCLKTLVSMNSIKLADVILVRMAFEKGDLQKSLYGALAMFIKSDPDNMLEVVVSHLAAAEAEVRSVALNLLAKMPDQRSAFRRMLGFSESISAMARNELFTEMARSADVWVDHVLDIFKTEKNPALRLQAMSLAKALKHQRLTPIFLHEMKNPDWMVRYAAMQVLGDMRSQQALPALVEALGKEESAMAAIQALDKFRDIRLAKPLFQKLLSGHEGEQLEILKVLLNMNDARLLPNIAKFLDSNAPKGKAKKAAAETIMDLCKATNTKVPARVTQIYDSLREKTVSDLPDLGLRLSDD